MLSCFYVYQWVRVDGTPYYIGKGKGRRAWIKEKRHIPPLDTSKILIIARSLSEHEAYLLETKLIYEFGRKDLGTGILINMTDGGDAPPNLKGLKKSPEARAKIAKSKIGNKARLGMKTSDATKAKMREARLNNPRLAELTAICSLKRTGQKRTEESKAKMSQAAKNRKPRNVHAA